MTAFGYGGNNTTSLWISGNISVWNFGRGDGETIHPVQENKQEYSFRMTKTAPRRLPMIFSLTCCEHRGIFRLHEAAMVHDAALMHPTCLSET